MKNIFTIQDRTTGLRSEISNDTLLSWSYSNEQLIICVTRMFFHITKENDVMPCFENILVLLKILFQEKRKIE
jgi:hypothetical protein